MKLNQSNKLFLLLVIFLVLVNISFAVDIDACNSSLNANNTVFTLNQSIIANGGGSSCFSITGENTTLDCNGFIIEGNGATSAISLNAAYNITIQNCVINGSFVSNALELINGANANTISNVDIVDVIISSHTDGVLFENSNGNTLTDLVINNTTDGILIDSASINNNFVDLGINSIGLGHAVIVQGNFTTISNASIINNFDGAGIYVNQADNFEISDSTLSGTYIDGIIYNEKGSNGVYDNLDVNVIGESSRGLRIVYGAPFSTNNTIINSRFISNSVGNYILVLKGDNSTFDNINITQNSTTNREALYVITEFSTISNVLVNTTNSNFYGIGDGDSCDGNILTNVRDTNGNEVIYATTSLSDQTFASMYICDNVGLTFDNITSNLVRINNVSNSVFNNFHGTGLFFDARDSIGLDFTNMNLNLSSSSNDFLDLYNTSYTFVSNITAYSNSGLGNYFLYVEDYSNQGEFKNLNIFDFDYAIEYYSDFNPDSDSINIIFDRLNIVNSYDAFYSCDGSFIVNNSVIKGFRNSAYYGDENEGNFYFLNTNITNSANFDYAMFEDNNINSNLTLVNVLFDNVSAGVYSSADNLRIINSTFNDIKDDNAIEIDGGANALIDNILINGYSNNGIISRGDNTTIIDSDIFNLDDIGHAIYFYNGDNHYIENVYIYNTSEGAGIFTESTTENLTINNTEIEFAEYGVYSNSNGLNIYNLTLIDILYDGLIPHNKADVVIDTVYFENISDEYIESSNGLCQYSIFNLTFNGENPWAFETTTVGLSGNYSQVYLCDIVDEVFDATSINLDSQTGFSSIYVGGADNFTIINLDLDNTSQVFEVVDSTNFNLINSTFIDVDVSGGAQQAINLDNVSNSVFDDLDFIDNQFRGMYIQSNSDNITIRNSNFYGNAQGILSFANNLEIYLNNFINHSDVMENGIYLPNEVHNYTIYNNYFENNEFGVVSDSALSTNINLDNGIVGNTWFDDFSETCNDINRNSICDDTYAVANTNGDTLAVANIAGQIGSCGVTLSLPGTYTVSSDLVVSGATCINIAGSNIEVDMNGHSVAGTGDDNNFISSIGPIENNSVKNGDLISSFGNPTSGGIFFSNDNGNFTIENITLSFIEAGSNNVILLTGPNNNIHDISGNIESGDFIGLNANGNQLSNIHVLTDNYGIILTGNNNVISDIYLGVNINPDLFYGISLSSSDNNLFTNLTFEEAEIAIQGDGMNNTVINSTFINTYEHILDISSCPQVTFINSVGHEGNQIKSYAYTTGVNLASQTLDALYLCNVNDSIFTNIIIGYTAEYDGIVSYYSNNNTFDGINMTSSGDNYFSNSDNNKIINSRFIDFRSYGLNLNTGSENNSVYNNYFNSASNIHYSMFTLSNYLNTTLHTGTNIIGLNNIGGNYWATTTNNGFSQTCGDVDKDGICDLTYIVKSDIIDNLPLTYLDNQVPTRTGGNVDLPMIYNESNNYWFNISVIDDRVVDSVKIDLNGTIYNLTNVTGNLYSYNITNLTAGNYTYQFMATDNSNNTWYGLVNTFSIRALTSNESFINETDYVVPENITILLVDELENVIIPVNITGSVEIDLENEVSDNSYRFTENVVLERQTGTVNYTVNIIPGTTLTGSSGWDKKLILPEITTNPSVPNGTTGSVDIAIKVGSDVRINFTDAVKIVLAGQAGKDAGWVSGSGALTEITTVCDDPDWPSNIPAGGECSIDVGSDLVIWTYHFTTFASGEWETTVVEPSDSSSHSSSGGGSTGYLNQVYQFGILANGEAKGQTLRKNDQITFQTKESGELHTLTLDDIDFSNVSITITIAITPKTIKLVEGSVYQIDTDDNNLIDTEVWFEFNNSVRATVYLQTIVETLDETKTNVDVVETDKEVQVVSPKNVDTTPADDKDTIDDLGSDILSDLDTGSKSNLGIILFVIFILAGISIGVFVYFKSKKQ